MSNTLTGLMPTIYAAMNVVSREMVGLVAAVSRDAQAEQVTLNQPIRSPVVPVMAASNITPGNIAATGADRNVGYVDLNITKQRKVSFNITGEEEKGLGANNSTIAQQSFAQAMRTLVNECEADLAAEYVNASRAYGTAGTTPFGTGDDLTDASEVLRILDDNGAPNSDRHIVLGSAAVAKLIGKQPSMFKVNEAGSDMTRRFGEMAQLFNAAFHHSGQIKAHTKGAGTGYDVVQSDVAIGDTEIGIHGGTVNTTGIKTGDVVTFAGDTNKYLVKTGTTATDGTLVINEPGLIIAPAAAVELTVGNSYAANMAFTRDAIQLAWRVPAVPSGGDQADDRTYVQDPVSGLVFEISVYRQYRQISIEVAACWGIKTISPRHMALLLG